MVVVPIADARLMLCKSSTYIGKIGSMDSYACCIYKDNTLKLLLSNLPREHLIGSHKNGGH